MKFSYEDLISGDSIFVQGVGHFRSPFLHELKPSKGIGISTYYFYLNLIAWDEDEYLKFLKMTAPSKARILEENKVSNIYDIVSLIKSVRELLCSALTFFIEEEVFWNDEERLFNVYSDTMKRAIGNINRENFEEVRDMILQMNYISLGTSNNPVKHSSKKSQELWEKAQKYLKDESSKSTGDKKMNLGNIISKLCASNAGYSLTNIYDLTVFQLYDQFFQIGYLRAMNINEMAYSHWGGENFDIQAWLTPITKL